jgi:hypothetical protein
MCYYKTIILLTLFLVSSSAEDVKSVTARIDQYRAIQSQLGNPMACQADADINSDQLAKAIDALIAVIEQDDYDKLYDVYITDRLKRIYLTTGVLNNKVVPAIIANSIPPISEDMKARLIGHAREKMGDDPEASHVWIDVFNSWLIANSEGVNVVVKSFGRGLLYARRDLMLMTLKSSAEGVRSNKIKPEIHGRRVDIYLSDSAYLRLYSAPSGKVLLDN